MVVDRREVCEHVRKSVYGPRPFYGHLLTERLAHGDSQGRAALPLILESASQYSLKKYMLILFYKDREAIGRPSQGLFKVVVHPPRKEDSALNISVIVKLATTCRTANSFVTTNDRSLFSRMRPVNGTLDACAQSAAWRFLSYVTRA